MRAGGAGYATPPGPRGIKPVMAAVHWKEYAIETAALAGFMTSALAFTTLLEHPASPVRHAIASPLARRALIGLAMGLTAASITYSPWGRRSGAHLNPSVTLTFLRLGKVAPVDALFYVIAQFVGGVAGVALVASVFARAVSHPTVNYVATRPGSAGLTAAFAAEAAISFGMMTLILIASNTPRFARFTGIFAACAVALYITIEAPLSGMSMNPARSLGPAIEAGVLGPLWIYFTAPPIGMLLAAERYVRRHGQAAVRCAKLSHPAHGSCHFRCGYREDRAASVIRWKSGCSA
jgi:aquaporin Z